MKAPFQLVFAVIKKDIRGLLPLVILTATVIFLDAIVAEFYQDAEGAMISFMAAYLPWFSLLTCSFLTISVFLQDPAASLSHDWLIRPIAKIDLLIAKLAFLGLTILGPMMLFGFFTSAASGHSLAESLLRATSVEAWWMFLLVPFVIVLAVLSRSLSHAIGNVFAALIVFMIPAVFLPAAPINPNSISGDNVNFGIMWILIYPICISLMLLMIWVYWLQYERKKVVLAGVISVVAAVFTMILFILPFTQSAWPVFLSIQQSIINNKDVLLANELVLDELYGCFPATVIGRSDDGLSGEHEEIIGAQHWSRLRLNRSGAGSISYATNVRSRNLPRDWRVVTLHAKAVYESQMSDEVIELKPARYTSENPFGTSSNTATHYWMLPNDTLKNIKDDLSTKLSLQYTLALLSPTQAELETDGVRRYLPGIGYCSADIDNIQNQIAVNCFKRGQQPALVAAELINVDASRVDSQIVNYSPSWIELLSGKHYELQIQSPSLVDHSSVLVTSYRMEEVVTKEIDFPGVIGGPISNCAIPSLDAPALYVQSNWSDSSPHEASLISVDTSVSLEVLDWGGVGKPLVLLPGGGATAHSYDLLAPKLAAKYRVIGITRRGFGGSSKPEYGYDMDRLGEDVMQVIEAMGIESPILIGHSLAGDELSTLGAKYPERLSGLIYLDAAYDRSVQNPEFGDIGRNLPPAPAPLPADMVSYQAIQSYLKRTGGNVLPEGEILASYGLSSFGGLGSAKFDPRIAQALMANIPRPNYTDISVPALAIYAMESSPQSYMRPWHDTEDPTIRQLTNQLYKLENQLKAIEIEKFDSEMPDSEVVIIMDASHGIFLSNEAAVLEAIDSFLDHTN